MSEEPNQKMFADIKELREQDKQNLEDAELFDDNFGDEDDIIDKESRAGMVGPGDAGVDYDEEGFLIADPEPDPEPEPKPDPETKPEPEPVPAQETKEEKTKRKEQILTALGFRCYDNGADGRKYTMMAHYNGTDLKLGKTFKLNGSHFWWAFEKDSDPNDMNRMLKSDVIAKIPIVHLYNEILNGVIEIPAKTLIGHVHKRHGKSLVIEFESPEDYEEKGASFGEGAVKSDEEGKFIAASYSAETKNQPAKMKVPRTIRLPGYETEMDTAPKTEKTAAPAAGHVPVTPTAQDITAEEAEMAPHSAKMQLAVREAVRITLAEVEDKIVNQGLAGFVKDIAIALFREAKLEEESEAQQKTGKWGER